LWRIFRYLSFLEGVERVGDVERGALASHYRLLADSSLPGRTLISAASANNARSISVRVRLIMSAHITHNEPVGFFLARSAILARSANLKMKIVL